MSPLRMTRDIAQQLTIAEQHEWFQQQRSRRAVLKGSLAGAGALMLGPSLLAERAGAAATSVGPTLVTRSGVASNGAIVPFASHISFGADPTSQMNIAWQVAAPVSNPFVRVGTSPSDLGERIAAELKNVNTPWADITEFVDSVPPAASSAKNPENQYYLHAAVGRLAPATTYFYTVGHQGYDPRYGGPFTQQVYSFTTAPREAQPFTFTAFGDQGSTYDAVQTANLVLAQQPAFHLHAGDVSYAESGGSGLLTDDYDPRVWDRFFVGTAQTAAQVPWMVSLGNHEMEPWYSPNGYGADVDRLDFPGNGPSVCPGTYSFTYGNGAIISLDPNDVSYEIPANLGYSHGAQTSWLAQTLATLRADSSISFIVVYFHHCAYSTCTAHGSEGGVRQYWAPLFDQYQVDLVINGHNHIYERTDPIRAGAATGAAPIGSTITPINDGTTYVCAGAAGQSLYSFSAPDSYEGNIDNDSAVAGYVNEPGGTTDPETVNWSRVRYTGYCLLVVSVEPASWKGTTSMLVRGLNENGVELDRFTLSRPA
jgi:Purple acid Phosphatase, N-terminal domain/Calcineurin-like phosphoesterase